MGIGLVNIRGPAATRRTAAQQGGSQGRNAVRCPPVAARVQLNVSDDMTLARKNAHSSGTALSDTVMPGWSLAVQ